METSQADRDSAPNAPGGVSPAAGDGGSAPGPSPVKGVLGFFAAVMLLYVVLGTGAQSLSAPLGLAWTQVFVFLLPAWAAAAGSNLRPTDFLLLSRRPSSAQLWLGLLCGVAAFPVANGLMALAAAFLPESWVREFDLSRLFQGPPLERAGIALAASLLAPLCEEAAFRGYLQGALLTRRRPAAAIWLGALLFALMHLDPVRFPAVLALGALFGWLAWRAGSLWPAVAAHAANNAIGSAIALASEIEPVPSPPEVGQAMLLAGAGALALAVLAAFYRRATQALPPSERLAARIDPADPSLRFRWYKVPPSLLGLGALGLALLFGMAVFHGALNR
ncbi:MAG TPA: type II CAAX endopeptidase family protein [Anaeromyxobacteraceae bacterium]|nr:type II CAAX endopeptidase family protein [Anaeromyxobacteraceae bacterium]